MSELWSAYWPVILVGLLIGIIVGYLVFRPRQRVTLSDTAPIRPHMAAPATPVPAPAPVRATAPIRAPTREGRGLADEAAAAASDVAGHILGSNVHGQLPGADGAPDDLQAMKGVGPKLAGILNAHGLTRFEEIASLSPGQIEALDADLGAFRGRLTRDRIVEQAQYLARGDLDGYKARFGAL
jgi:predicted flap endonuclease-1-like 5' DNA nuclease